MHFTLNNEDTNMDNHKTTLPPASDLAREDAVAAFSDEPRFSIWALCGSLTENRANVPLSELRRITQALELIAEDPFGPLAQRFAPIPGLVQ